jgi:hypothetical protein
MRIGLDAQLYSFGLDFSQSQAQPQLTGLIGFKALKRGDNKEIEGTSMARFVPVAGYREKVYKIEIPAFLRGSVLDRC